MSGHAFILWVMLKTSSDTSLRSDTYSSFAACIAAGDKTKAEFSTSFITVKTVCTRKD